MCEANGERTRQQGHWLMTASRGDPERIDWITFSAVIEAKPAAARSACTVAVSLYGGETSDSGSRDRNCPTTVTTTSHTLPSRLPHTLNRKRPPSLRTRKASWNAVTLSGKNMTPNWQTT